MTRRALLSAALILSFGAASAAPKYFGTAENAATIVVRAGVGGAARPGRWLPADVAVTAGGAAFQGSVVVEWGGAIARRDVSLGPSSATRVTLLVRTIAATPAIRVSLVGADGRVAASSETPLALLPVDDPATLCIGNVPSASVCTVTIPEAEAPSSWRGFDLADSVIWQTGRSTPGESAKAFALWQAARWWQDSGVVDPVVAPFDTDSRLENRTSFSLIAFVAALIALTGFAAWRRAPLFLLAGVPLAVTAGGVALVTRSSRDVDIQAATFVHQFAGAPQSVVLMRGDVEHPSAQPLEISPEIGAGSLDVVRGLQHTDSTASLDGGPVYRNTAGRGVTQRIELNGVVDAEWLSVAYRGGELVVENHSPFALNDCQIRSADTAPLGAIASGAASRAAAPGALAPGDSVVCRLPADWMKWTARGATVATRGSAFVIFHAWPGPAATPAVPLAAR